MSNLIEFNDVWKTYKMGDEKVNALAGLDLTLEEGSFTAVMGPSGSGKSTFLHIAGILDMPTEGTFRIKGKDTSRLSSKEQAHLRRNEIGFVFQRFNLMPQLTALENVMLPMINENTEKPKTHGQNGTGRQIQQTTRTTLRRRTTTRRNIPGFN